MTTLKRDGYLTAEELCRQGNLTLDQLVTLNNARLLVPRMSDSRYRPRLVRWARKLSYLLEHGWQVAEIKHWAKWRWYTPDSMKWPPDRSKWQVE